jgi:hypothetical protein
VVEEFDPMGLVVIGGVVALTLQGGPELDVGVEVGAGFADRLEGAVEFGWAGAVAVAEQSVVLAASPTCMSAGRTTSRDGRPIR